MNCIWIILLLLCSGNRKCTTENSCGSGQRGAFDEGFGDKGDQTCQGGDFMKPRKRHPFDDQDDQCPCTREYDYYQAEASGTDKDDDEKDPKSDKDK